MTYTEHRRAAEYLAERKATPLPSSDEWLAENKPKPCAPTRASHSMASYRPRSQK